MEPFSVYYGWIFLPVVQYFGKLIDEPKLEQKQ